MSALRFRVALFSGVCALFAVFAGDARSEPDAALVALQQWRGAFDNVRVRYTCKSLSEEEGAGSYTTEWIWTNELLFRMDTVDYSVDGVAESRSLVGCDGLVSYNGDYAISPTGEDFLQSLQTAQLNGQNQSNTGAMGAIVLPLHGLWVANRCSWLADDFDALGVNHVGPVEVDGVACEQYAYVQGSETGSDRHRWILALDPAHGYLPRRVTGENLSNPELNQHGWNFTVAEFGQTEAGIWYPSRGSLVSPNFAQDWRIDEIVFNDDYDVADFAPPAPMEGTYVAGNTASYIAGGADAEPPEFVRALRESKEANREPNQPVVAAPAGGSTWTWGALIAIGGILCIVIANRLSRV